MHRHGRGRARQEAMDGAQREDKRRGRGSQRRADRRAPPIRPARDEPRRRQEDGRRPDDDRGPQAPPADGTPGLPQHRPVAGPAHPRRVRRGLRRPGHDRAGDHRLRLGPGRRGRSGVRDGARDRPPPRRGGLRGHHRRRAGRHGGGEPRLPGGRRPVGRVQHRAAPRAVDQRRTSISGSSSGTSSPARRCS